MVLRNVFSIGTDEAGYGPNLGPLVVSATLWEGEPGPIEGVIDSKKLYTSHGSLARLERVVLGALTLLENKPVASWKHLLRVVAEIEPEEPLWERDVDFVLPLDVSREEIHETASRLSSLRAIRSRVVQPGEFNRRLLTEGLKSNLLMSETLRLVRDVVDTLPPRAEVRIFFDKLGGRNAYAPALYEEFPEARLTILEESRPVSVYRLEDEDRLILARFEAKGESHPETALASIFSKYLREMAMRAFNGFWCARITGLKPTAGYPADAPRFFQAIREECRKLGVEPASVWRNK